MDSYVKSEFHKGITTIEFFHPQSNSLPLALLEELAQAIHGAGNDEETKLIVLRSGGDKAFCAGASFDELVKIKTEEEGLRFFSGFAHVFNTIRKCPTFIIARVQGRCVGGGLGLAAAADYAFATESAEIKLSELALGIGPFVVAPVIERKTGFSAFSQLALNATTWRSASWARRNGIFSELYGTIEELDEAIMKLCDVLVHVSPLAMAEMHKVFWEGTKHWDKLLFERAAISGRLVVSPFTKEAIQKHKKNKNS